MQPTTPQVAQPTPTGVQQTTPLAPQVVTGAVGGRPNSPPTTATATGAIEGTVGQASQFPLQAMPFTPHNSGRKIIGYYGERH